MSKEQPQEPDTSKELEFNESDLEVVEISDDGLEAVDQTTAQAKKEAKKTAKKLLTPEERKLLIRKRILIGAGVTVTLLIILLAVPFTRWPLLNGVGLRGKLEVHLQDKTSGKPIYKATVKLDDGSFGLTNKQGVITFAGTKLGKRKLIIQKSGYADLAPEVTNSIGGSKPQITLRAIGIKLDVDIKNWLSGDVIEGATVAYGESTAVSDGTGRASLIIPPTDQQKVTLTLSAPNFLSKQVNTDVDVASREVLLVSAQKNYFVSKRDGKFDIFSTNLDGTNQQKIIEATGKEDETVEQFTINRNNKQAVLVATRDGKIVNNKRVAGIYVIDLQAATIKKVDEGSDVQLLDWSDTTLAYTKSIPELNYDDPSLMRVVTLNVANNKLSEVAQANYFSVATVAQTKLFYLPSDAYRNIENSVLTSIDVASGAKKTYLSDKVIQYATRASYSTLELQDNNGTSYELQVAAGSARAMDRRPTTGIQVATNPANNQAIWSTIRDGQGTLIVRDLKSNQERTVLKVGGLTYPARFISDDLAIVRVATSQETADYVVSVKSGKITKVVDVSNVGLSAARL